MHPIRTLAILLAAAPLAGCLRGGFDLAPEDQIATDLEELLVALSSVGAGAETLDEPSGETVFRASETVCYPMYLGCEICLETNGHALAGTASLTVDPLPCEASISFGGRSLTYSLEEYAFTGTWDGNIAGDYEVSLTGTRASTTTVSGTRWDGEYDSSLEIVEAAASYEDGAVSSFSVEYVYTSWGGHAWTVTVAYDGASFTGSASRDDGAVSCTISGMPGSMDVACE